MSRLCSRFILCQRWPSVVLAVVLAISLTAGYLSGVPVSPPVVMATCGPSYARCLPDTGATASLTVGHTYEDPNTHVKYNVEPVTTDTWEVTAKYFSDNTGYACLCQQLQTAQATVEVSWSDANQTWTATCTAGCDSVNGPIYGVQACPSGGCGGNPPLIPYDHSWAYELIVDIDHTLPAVYCLPVNKVPFLGEVDFVATALDDGDVIDDCEHGKAVTPDVSAPVAANDFGTFECDFTCADATGPSVEVEYVDP